MKLWKENVWIPVLAVIITTGCLRGPKVSGPVDIDSEYVVDLDDASFDSLIIKNGCEAIVEFYSPICKACQAMHPKYDSIAMTFGDSLLVARVDADAQTQLSETYSITVVPSFAFFSDGKIIRVESMTADENPIDTLTERINRLLDGTLTAITTDTGDTGDTIPSGYITLDSLSFDSTVLRQGRVAMAFFMVPTGLPCIRMDSVVSEMTPQFEGRAVIAKVIVVWGVEPLYQRYGITSVPRFLFFKDGVQIEEEQRLGTYTVDELAGVLEKLLEE